MTVRVITGDCREALRTLPDESAHCVVTSPPYWGLRDYQIEPSIWGGDPACDHAWGGGLRRHKGGPAGNGVMLAGGRSVVKAQDGVRDIAAGSFCAHCGAWRGCHGLEPSYQLYIEHAIEIFREVRRVLRADGTLWLNLGDSYATRPYGDRHTFDPKYNGRQRAAGYPNRSFAHDLKHKDMCGIPWRVALALQADGWWLRQDVIWHKPNPMPESVADRCTKAHEYLFLLSKSDRYYFDAKAIAEPASGNTHQRTASKPSPSAVPGASSHSGLHKNTRTPGVGPKSAAEGTAVRAKESFHASTAEVLATRNKRSVWTVQTAPFPEAHFATFPPALIEPCILAGCPQGGVVLDPFGGAGTTGLVADRLQRSAILIELNPGYAEMARRRIERDAPLFQSAAE